MLNTAEITVAYKNAPKPGKKMWSIKDTNGNYYNLFPTDQGNFQQGETYMITFETNEQGYHTIKSPRREAAGPAPMPVAKANGVAPNNSHTKSVEMAAMGILGRAYHGTGQLPSAETIEMQLRAIVVAWQRVFNGN